MKDQCKLILAVGLLAVTTLASVPAVAQHNPTQPQGVLVLNGSGQPVPTAPQGTTNVAGTVNIGNSPSVTLANTPNVVISGTPTVALSPGGVTGVTNPLNNQSNPTPLAVLEAFQPYEDGCGLNIVSGISASCSFSQIPAGKRLVIEEFDAELFMDSTIKPIDLSLNVSAVVGHYFPTTFMGTQGLTSYFSTHQQTRLYQAAGFQPTCGLTLSDSANFGTAYCRISGFLVDLP